MEGKILLVVLVVLACSLQSVWSQITESTTESATQSTTNTESTTDISTETTILPLFSCRESKGVPVNLTIVGGLWYEAVRDTNLNMQCKEISVPEKASEENNLGIEISYVDSSNGKWESAKKTMDFPWNTDTQNGIFTLNREKPITYKLINLESSYALFCSYGDESPDTHYMIWTRKAILSTEDKNAAQNVIVNMFPEVNPVWVEHSVEKCSAMRTAGGALVALALGLLIYRRNI